MDRKTKKPPPASGSGVSSVKIFFQGDLPRTSSQDSDSGTVADFKSSVATHPATQVRS